MEQEIEQAESSLKKFTEALGVLKDHVQPLLTSLDKLRSLEDDESIDGLHRARLHIVLCYTVNSLFCMYLRTQGVDPLTHPVSEEIVRVQEAFLRFRKVVDGQSVDSLKPRRRTNRDIVNAQLEAAKLGSIIFPEESELLKALRNEQTKTLSKKFDSQDSGDENSGDGIVDHEEEEGGDGDDDDDQAAKILTERKASARLKKRTKALAEAKKEEARKSSNKKTKKKNKKRYEKEKREKNKVIQETNANGTDTAESEALQGQQDEIESSASKRRKVE